MDLDKLTKEELVGELTRRGEDVRGRKPVLLERLRELLKEEEFQSQGARKQAKEETDKLHEECEPKKADDGKSVKSGSSRSGGGSAASSKPASSVRTSVSIVSARALERARLAGLSAKKEALKKRHQLEEEEAALRKKREELEIQAEIDESEAKEKVLEEMLKVEHATRTARGAKLQVLKVMVGLDKETVVTNAFLDSGSTHSFISKHLLQKMKVTPQNNSSLRVCTIRGEAVMDSCLVPGLVIGSLDGDNCMELPPLYVLDHIPVTSEDIPSEEDGPPETWPSDPEAGEGVSEHDPEVKTSTCLSSVEGNADAVRPMKRLVNHYSTWRRLTRAVAWIRRVLRMLRDKKRGGIMSSPAELSVQEIADAEKLIILSEQEASFPQEMKDLRAGKEVRLSSPLARLDPGLQDGVLRARGRLRNSALCETAKCPAILPKKGRVIDMLIEDFHRRAGHEGRQHVMADISHQLRALHLTVSSDGSTVTSAATAETIRPRKCC
ncbi:hypothetical protein FJT64_014852 [Amphibalanus amphitrite]|uniref:SAP domain-containing protein n=1 Tax=Amphibalanus amphitrite TaxID=1232801 RepID=A0A6A4V0G4_AMPAM|nr:hypothetical protein FJT64_014852 [Amphibalanus amphitrite]